MKKRVPRWTRPTEIRPAFAEDEEQRVDGPKSERAAYAIDKIEGA